TATCTPGTPWPCAFVTTPCTVRLLGEITILPVSVLPDWEGSTPGALPCCTTPPVLAAHTVNGPRTRGTAGMRKAPVGSAVTEKYCNRETLARGTGAPVESTT